MATGLVWYDGFDDAALTEYYAVFSGATLTGSARTGSFALIVGDADDINRTLGVATATIYFGFAFMFTSNPSGTRVLARFYDGATLHVDLRISNTRVLFTTRNGTTLGVGTAVLTAGVWYYVEGKIVINDTTGVFDVRINEVSDSTFSGDTRNGAGAQITNVAIGDWPVAGGAISHRFDDFYVVDGSVGGSTYLGDIRVDTYYPDGDGDNEDFVPSAGTDNWANVDEAGAPDGDTTYNESDTPGDKDTFALQNTTGQGATVFGVAHIYRARKTDAGAREMRGLLKSAGGTTANQATQSLSSSYVSYFEHNELEPGGAAWDETKVDGLKAGYEVVT